MLNILSFADDLSTDRICLPIYWARPPRALRYPKAICRPKDFFLYSRLLLLAQGSCLTLYPSRATHVYCGNYVFFGLAPSFSAQKRGCLKFFTFDLLTASHKRILRIHSFTRPLSVAFARCQLLIANKTNWLQMLLALIQCGFQWNLRAETCFRENTLPGPHCWSE